MIDPKISFLDLAALISSTLQKHNIQAVLSGGAAVQVHTENIYLTKDLDFVTSESLKVIAHALQDLGFVRQKGRRYFAHPELEWLIEFPPGPVSVGNRQIQPGECLTIETSFGNLLVLTAMQSAMDRLAAYFYWNDRQSLDQACLIAQQHKLDMEFIQEWAKSEDQLEKFQFFQLLVINRHGRL